jgi:hypothetical protein
VLGTVSCRSEKQVSGLYPAGMFCTIFDKGRDVLRKDNVKVGMFCANKMKGGDVYRKDSKKVGMFLAKTISC